MTTATQTVCQQLATLLLHDDALACDVLEQHSDLLKAAFPQHFPQISEGIESFEFELALAALQDAGVLCTGVAGPTWAQLSPKKGASILIVDDSPLNLVLLSNMLMKYYQVRVANCGEKALDIAFSLPTPDLILLDIMMPRMDGYQVFRRLKNTAHTRNIPVIFCTGRSDLAFEKKALELGAADFIAKPVHIDIARHRIRNLLEREGLRKEVESFRDHLAHLVTERSSQLLERMEQLTAIFELSPDGFVSFDGERHVTYASPAFFRMTGLNDADIAGLNETDFSALIARGCIPAARFAGCAALRLPHPLEPYNPRQRIEWAGAARRILEVGLRVSEAGSIAQILYFRDVTHETEVAQMKSDFLNTAAHELRTPMVSIYGFAEVLMNRELDEASRQDAYSIIFKRAEQMMAITNKLVDLSQIEAQHGKNFVSKP
jgi:CheY-like chemotaxis protein